MSKLLITGGCSFSECVTGSHTWPNHLENYLSPNYTAIHTGANSRGNGLISRAIFYNISDQLKVVNPQDMLVGIMWSSPIRHDFYSQHQLDITPRHGNPANFKPTNKTKSGWIILNQLWNDSTSKNYYTNFYDTVGSFIYTIEHILRLQWFLKLHNIKYFMSTYTSEVFPSEFMIHPEVKYLYDQIDRNHFLPIAGEFDWCTEYMPNDFPLANDNHPGIEQHKAFTEQVIIPFLKEKQYI